MTDNPLLAAGEPSKTLASRELAPLLSFIDASLRGRRTPLVIALDGRSGTGKSTIARAIAAARGAAVVPLDDFFDASVPGAQWDAWSPAERLSRVYDWTRVRNDALVPLRARQTGRWHPFDFAAGPHADGSYALRTDAVECAPHSLIILEGAYSASKPLADLVDFTILVEASAEEREERLQARERADFLAAWHARWDAVEELYENVVRSRERFGLVISSSGAPRNTRSDLNAAVALAAWWIPVAAVSIALHFAVLSAFQTIVKPPRPELLSLAVNTVPALQIGIWWYNRILGDPSLYGSTRRSAWTRSSLLALIIAVLGAVLIANIRERGFDLVSPFLLWPTLAGIGGVIKTAIALRRHAGRLSK